MRYSSAVRFLFVLMLTSFTVSLSTAYALSLDEYLQSMPPETPTEADALFAQLAEESDTLLTSLCDRILPPNQVPDAEAQFAIYGLVKHVVLPGREVQRDRVARCLEKALHNADNPEVSRFFMAQLRVCGDAKSLKELESYVCDPVLCEDAVQSIADIGSFSALVPLFMLNCNEAPQKDASVQNALARFNSMADFTPEGTGLTQELLMALADPSIQEDQERLVTLCRDALHLENVKPQYKAMVLQALVTAAGEEALPLLLEAAQSSEPLLWGTALFLTTQLTSATTTQAWLEALPDFSAVVQPAVLRMLANRDDPAVAKAIQESCSHDAMEMRLAAYECVTRTSDSSMTGILLDALAQAQDKLEINAIQAALLRITDLEDAALRALDNRPDYETNMSTETKIVSLEIIAERRMESAPFKDAVYGFIEDENGEVRRKAFAALGATGELSDIELLFQSLLEEEANAEKTEAGEAIVALSNRYEAADDVTVKTGEMLTHATGNNCAALMKVLSAIGTAQALDITAAEAERALRGEREDSEGAAPYLDALGRWASLDAVEILDGLWEKAPDESLRMEVLKHYIASIQRNYPQAQKQQPVLAALEEKCKTDAERKAVNTALARVEKDLKQKK
ncbi:MAG: HEAT repeat domain-containing protein [Candidatus Hydrogenedentales bacterium]